MSVMAFAGVDVLVEWTGSKGKCPMPEVCPDHGECYPLKIDVVDGHGILVDALVEHVWGCLEPHAATTMAHHLVGRIADKYCAQLHE